MSPNVIVETKYLATLYGVPTVDLIQWLSTEAGSGPVSPIDSADQATNKLLADPRVAPLKLKWKNVSQQLSIVEVITSQRLSLQSEESAGAVETVEQDMKEFCKIVEEIKIASGIVADQSRPIFGSNQNENNQKLNTLSSTLYLQFIQKYCMK